MHIEGKGWTDAGHQVIRIANIEHCVDNRKINLSLSPDCVTYHVLKYKKKITNNKRTMVALNQSP